MSIPHVTKYLTTVYLPFYAFADLAAILLLFFSTTSCYYTHTSNYNSRYLLLALEQYLALYLYGIQDMLQKYRHKSVVLHSPGFIFPPKFLLLSTFSPRDYNERKLVCLQWVLSTPLTHQKSHPREINVKSFDELEDIVRRIKKDFCIGIVLISIQFFFYFELQ